MGIVEFLTARLDEDQAAAEAATRGPWDADPNDFAGDEYWRIHTRLSVNPRVIEVAGSGYEGGGIHEESDARHIARHDPARVLREVEAKRAQVALHVPEYIETINPDRDEISGEICTLCDEPFPCDSLKLMAAPDAEHADYNPAWTIAT